MRSVVRLLPKPISSSAVATGRPRSRQSYNGREQMISASMLLRASVFLGLHLSLLAVILALA